MHCEGLFVGGLLRYVRVLVVALLPRQGEHVDVCVLHQFLLDAGGGDVNQVTGTGLATAGCKISWSHTHHGSSSHHPCP